MGSARTAILLLVATACGDNNTAANQADAAGSAATPDAAELAQCTIGHAEKIRFPQSAGCGNDGSIEFCIPDNNPTVVSTLSAIAPTITCAPGGGRANCLASPGLLLCFYPTAVPTECVTQYGAMTDAAWSQVCTISGLPEVNEIVQTIVE